MLRSLRSEISVAPCRADPKGIAVGVPCRVQCHFVNIIAMLAASGASAHPSFLPAAPRVRPIGTRHHVRAQTRSHDCSGNFEHASPAQSQPWYVHLAQFVQCWIRSTATCRPREPIHQFGRPQNNGRFGLHDVGSHQHVIRAGSPLTKCTCSRCSTG